MSSHQFCPLLLIECEKSSHSIKCHLKCMCVRMPGDPADVLLSSEFLTIVKTEARQLRHKNAQVFRLTIEQSEHEVTAEAAAKAKVTWHAKEQDRLVWRFTGQIYFDVVINGSRSYDNTPPAVDFYMEVYNHTGDLKGKGLVRKW